MASSLSLTFFFFSYRHLSSLSICSFIIVYRFYCWISNCSMILRNDFSSLSTSSLNFFLTFYSSFPYKSSQTLLFLSIWSTSSSISLTMRLISRTKKTFINIKQWKSKHTFEGDRHDLVFRVGVLQDTFGAKHLLVTFAEELNFFVFMDIAKLNATILSGSWCAALCRIWVHLSYW